MRFASISFLFRFRFVYVSKPTLGHLKVYIEHGITESHPVIKVVQDVLNGSDTHGHQLGNLERVEADVSHEPDT